MKKILLVILVLSLSSLAYAEVVKLKTGQTIEGEIVERTDEFIKVNFAGVPLTYYLDEIDSIDGKPQKPQEIFADNVRQAEHYRVQGYESYSAGNRQQAIIHYEKALQIDPNNVDTYISLGTIYGELNQYQQAIASYGKALQMDPTNATAHYDIGIVYNRLGQNQQAMSYLEKAVELSTASENCEGDNWTDLVNLCGDADKQIEQFKAELEEVKAICLRESMVLETVLKCKNNKSMIKVVIDSLAEQGMK